MSDNNNSPAKVEPAVVAATQETETPTTEKDAENKKDSDERPKIANKRVFILGVVMTLFINLLLLVVWYVFSSNNNVPSVPIIGQTVN